jgi:uncharacterized protein (TIGR00299 family) protein
MRQHGQEHREPPRGATLSRTTASRLHIDARRGIAGDMLLAALFDLGVPESAVLGPLKGSLPPFRASVTSVQRRSIGALALEIESQESSPPRRGLDEIEKIICSADLPRRAKEWAGRCFRILAEAEGAVHGVPPESVHFHEIGALDSLVDTIGVCLAVAWLDPIEITCSSIPLGSGTVRTEHGLLSVPAPAVLRLLEGVPTHPYPVDREVTTPTGAALAIALADRFTEGTAGTLIASGSGAGQREAPPEQAPNVLRVWTTAAEAVNVEEVTLLETNLDTSSGEDAGSWIESFLEGGALDAWIVPTIQKKGRPGLLLSVLTHADAEDALRREIFRRTGTLGVRSRRLTREVLPREVVKMTIAGHRVRVKRAWLDGSLISERPEHEDLARIARETGRPLREIRAEIEAELGRNRGRSEGAR